MYPRLATVVAVLLAVTSACRIEPTPREYIDRQLPTADVHALAETMLRERITLIVQSLQAGDAETARSLLEPAPEVIVLGPGEGERFTGPAEIDAILELAAVARAGRVELRDLQVQVSTRATVGWFAAWLEVQLPDTEPLPLRVTGVYAEREGRWQLQLAHLSAPSPMLTGAAQPLQPGPAPSPAPGGDG